MTALHAGPLRIGTRGSALALAQAGLVAKALSAAGVANELRVIETEGDVRQPDTAWGEGAFVKAIERALMTGEIDLAVHSAKDVPTDEDTRLTIAAYLPRADPHDALVTPVGRPAPLKDLSPGTIVGTDSPRRGAFLRAERPDLEVRPLHGNVDTRLRRLDEGEAGALLLAVAGLARLGRQDRVGQVLPAEIMPPAAGQGAICVQVRAGEAQVVGAVAAIDDTATRLEVETERALLQATGGGCRSPIGVLARVEAGRIEITAGFASPDGSVKVLEHAAGGVEQRHDLALELANRLVFAAEPARRPLVLVTRAAEDATSLVDHLERAGLRALVVPAIGIEPTPSAELDGHLARLAGYRWVVATSANAVRAVAAAVARADQPLSGVSCAAVGPQTARVLRDLGADPVWMPRRATAQALAEELPVADGDTVLWPHGQLADMRPAATLTARGAVVDAVAVYRTLVGPDTSRPLMAAALASGLGAVVFASPSAVRGTVALAPPSEIGVLLRLPAISIGPRTAAAARFAGFVSVVEAASPSPAAIAQAAARLG